MTKKYKREKKKKTIKMEIDSSEKYILCVGMCVFDAIHSLDIFPTEDSDHR